MSGDCKRRGQTLLTSVGRMACPRRTLRRLGAA